jgi:hypothetical protein
MLGIHRIVSLIAHISGTVVVSRRILLFGFWWQRISNCAMKLSRGKFAAYLQLLHPVLTFGRLALLAFSALADLALPESAMMMLFRPYALLASHPSVALFVLGSSSVPGPAVVYRVRKLLIKEIYGGYKRRMARAAIL